MAARRPAGAAIPPPTSTAQRRRAKASRTRPPSGPLPASPPAVRPPQLRQPWPMPWMQGPGRTCHPTGAAVTRQPPLPGRAGGWPSPGAGAGGPGSSPTDRPGAARRPRAGQRRLPPAASGSLRAPPPGACPSSAARLPDHGRSAASGLEACPERFCRTPPGPPPRGRADLRPATSAPGRAHCECQRQRAQTPSPLAPQGAVARVVWQSGCQQRTPAKGW
mmetsp:Transcript_102411/g.298628  ORF Transcript_102411/g.298628 Transcript_102411/m.298628 type:complete len:220 (-) Transcript_102411:684-1343(-)